MHPEDAPHLLELLERVVSSLGIDVRYEKLGEEGDAAQTRSGLCRIKERRVLLVDSRLSPFERCRVVARELKRFDISAIFVPPALRQMIDDSGGDI